MPEQFSHGYALLVGVGAALFQPWSLPVTVRDAQAMQACLLDPSLCAYPADEGHVRLLHDDAATRRAVLDGLAWLAACAQADAEATVVVYFSGHGLQDESSGRYFLLTHDTFPHDLPGSALTAVELTAALRAIHARRLLVVIDSCHAEGMATSKGQSLRPPGFQASALPASAVTALKEGAGRAVFTSSRGAQSSYVRPDGTLSLYTGHFLEALQGAGSRPGERVVRLSNLMHHLSATVPASAASLANSEQIPFFDLAAEDFAVALLRGGKGLPSAGWQAAPVAAPAAYRAEAHGRDIAQAQGPGAQAASGGSIRAQGGKGCQGAAPVW